MADPMASRPRALGYGFLSHTSVKDSTGATSADCTSRRDIASNMDPKSYSGRMPTGRARSERALSKGQIRATDDGLRWSTR